MKSSVKSCVAAAGPGNNAISMYLAEIEPADTRFVVSSTSLSTTARSEAISISSGFLHLYLDPETARCLGEQLIAAADHYDEQTAEPSCPA